MNDRLTAEIERILQISDLDYAPEETAKQSIIEPVLAALGWNTSSIEEVEREYTIEGVGDVDYALRIRGENKVFLEAKRVRAHLIDHTKQLQDYVSAEGVPLAVLTNGREWWFYLPLRAGTWSRKRFCTINLLKEDISSVVRQLTQFLSKEAIASGDAVRNADILRAWQFLISPDNSLVELLSKKVKELSGGWEPESDLVKRFFIDAIVATPTLSIPNSPSTPIVRPLPTPPRRPKSSQRSQSVSSYKNKSLVGFTILGSRYQSGDWIQLLMTVSERIYQLRIDEFHRALELKGRKNYYFCRNPGELPQDQKWWKLLGSSGYYVWSNLSSDQCVQISHELLAKFGYSSNDLQIETA